MKAALNAALEAATKILPTQNPLTNFIHHNPLHSFEGRGFRDGVERAAQLTGARAWCTSEFYRDAYGVGRILERDVDDVIRREVEPQPLRMPGLTMCRQEALRLLMLAPETGVHEPEASAWVLREQLYEKELPQGLDRQSEERLRLAGRPVHVLKALWSACTAVASHEPGEAPASKRLAHSVLASLDMDLDAAVEPTLVRWALAYLDVGQAVWAMPDRENGFFVCTLGLLDTWGTRLRPGGVWLREEARRLRAEKVDSATSVVESLEAIGVQRSDVEAFSVDTLLRMPGFGGMFERLDKRADLAPTEAVPPAKLVDFLAVRLLLERAAVRGALSKLAGDCGTRPLLEVLAQFETSRADSHASYRKIAPFFHVALSLGITAGAIERATTAELAQLHALSREASGNMTRWLWQLAYERRYRMELLDGLALHQPHALAAKDPHTQFIMCIDDREESFRRHLEEVDPGYETFGYAGYYNVAIRFQGLGKSGTRALCPGAMKPTHAMMELPAAGAAGRALDLGAQLVPHGADSGIVRSALENIFGWVALVPMAYRLLFPERSGRKRRARRKAATTLTLLRSPDSATAFGLPLGYTEEEMAKVVGDALEGMGLSHGFARLVVACGHGSHNVNNPHAAGYNCGACAGGNGGPNARAFAAMCNRPGVRKRLAERGIRIPDSTYFLGAVHETAGDLVELFDVDEVPASHRQQLNRLRADLVETARRDAHERCRKFMSAPLDITEAEALEHVIGRTEDLAQARPEYNHVMNSACIVGRRTATRGLFLDRRAFLVSYDPSSDPTSEKLSALLASVGPVGAGINLEYFFSFVDNEVYGAGTKLPQNVVGLLSVMNGSASDLCTGLVEQMIEIHEPMRLLLIVEATPETAQAAIAPHPGLKNLVENRWVLVATLDPDDGTIHFLHPTGFEKHELEAGELPAFARSSEVIKNRRSSLRPARVTTLTREVAL